jgi:hypothetical protein
MRNSATWKNTMWDRLSYIFETVFSRVIEAKQFNDDEMVVGFPYVSP